VGVERKDDPSEARARRNVKLRAPQMGSQVDLCPRLAPAATHEARSGASSSPQVNRTAAAPITTLRTRADAH
jgi:hypothetical protein